MQSNVTVPAGESKLRLWLLIVVLAVAIFGGAAYGYYSWYKSNEPPPSLETVDGSGLQGMMKIQGGDLTGYRKLEAADAPSVCTGTSVEVEKGTNYLYSTSAVTLKDFYDSIAVKENVGRTFLFLFYSPGETKYGEGFYFYPTDETKYKATHIKLDSGIDYSIPSYRSVVLYNDEKMKICGGKIKVALGKELTVAEEDSLFASLSPLPKGWVLVPFGWNMDFVDFFGTELGDYVTSAWVQSGSEATKVKDANLSKIKATIGASGTRSMWLKTKNGLDLPAIIAAQSQGGDGSDGGQSGLKNECTADFKCVRDEKSCVKLPSGDQICDSLDKEVLCGRITCGEGTICQVTPAVIAATGGKINAPAELKCVPLVPEGAVNCTKQSDCSDGSSCIAHSADIFICKTKEQVDAVCPDGMVASLNVPDDKGPATVICSPVVVEEPECGADKACSGDREVCYKVPLVDGGSTFACLEGFVKPCDVYPAPEGMNCSVNNGAKPAEVLWSPISLFQQITSVESGIMTHATDFASVYDGSLWKVLFDGEQLLEYKDSLVSYGAGAGAEGYFSPDETDSVSVPVVIGYNGYNVVASNGVMIGDMPSVVKPSTVDGSNHYLAVLYNSEGSVFVWPGALASAINFPFVEPASGTEILPAGSSFILYSSKATELYGTQKFSTLTLDPNYIFYYLSGPGKLLEVKQGLNSFKADKDLKLSDVFDVLKMNITGDEKGLDFAVVYFESRDSVDGYVYPSKLVDNFKSAKAIEDPSTFSIPSGKEFILFSTGTVKVPSSSGFSVSSLD